MVKKEITSYINGTWTRPNPGAERIEVKNPATQESIAELVCADKKEVCQAASIAKQCFVSGNWSQQSAAYRKKILLKIADLIIENKEQLALLEIANTGIPKTQMLNRHIVRSAYNFEYFAEYISQFFGKVYEQNKEYMTYIKYEPIGVAGLIAPWNAPLALTTMKIAESIAFGNSCVFKPSELTPLSFTFFCDLLKESGLPDGVVNMVNGTGEITGSAITQSQDIDVIIFTGGTKTGSKIASTAGLGLKKVACELGGKSAYIIDETADFERALDSSLIANFSNNGQQCLAGSRILVQNSIIDKYIKSFIPRVKNLKVGDPLDSSTEVGPVISEFQLSRMLDYANSIDGKKVKLLCGGVKCKQGGKHKNGNYFMPTVVKSTNNKETICQEEIFGPFATILGFDTIDEAIEIANDSQFGLASYLWSTDVRTIMRVQDQIRAGIVWVNTHLMRDLNAPFGGYKHSGIGRSGGDWSRDLFTEVKTVSIPLVDFPIDKIGNHA